MDEKTEFTKALEQANSLLKNIQKCIDARLSVEVVTWEDVENAAVMVDGLLVVYNHLYHEGKGN